MEMAKVLDKNSIEEKYDCQFKGLQYESLKNAIPKEWKKTLNGDNQCVNFTLGKDTTIYIDKTYKKLVEISTKDICR